VGEVDAVPDLRGALVGAMISSVFGAAWTAWGASGFSGAVSGLIRLAGLVVGAIILLWCTRLWRGAPRGDQPAESGSMFSSRGYRLVVAAEIAALVAGNALLAASGQREYIIAWVATVVGIHFLAFGRLFWAGFYWLGAALIAAGIAGVAVGLAGGGASRIEAVSGLIAATSLFSAGGSTILTARGQPHE
jgi:hypothetical protein